jgi:hypothetical protein
VDDIVATDTLGPGLLDGWPDDAFVGLVEIESAAGRVVGFLAEAHDHEAFV